MRSCRAFCQSSLAERNPSSFLCSASCSSFSFLAFSAFSASEACLASSSSLSLSFLLSSSSRRFSSSTFLRLSSSSLRTRSSSSRFLRSASCAVRTLSSSLPMTPSMCSHSSLLRASHSVRSRSISLSRRSLIAVTYSRARCRVVARSSACSRATCACVACCTRCRRLLASDWLCRATRCGGLVSLGVGRRRGGGRDARATLL